MIISTDIVEQPVPAGTEYSAAKGGLEAAARVLAVREAGHGILTNVVRPGLTSTERVLATPCLGQPVIDAEAARTPTGTSLHSRGRGEPRLLRRLHRQRACQR